MRKYLTLFPTLLLLLTLSTLNQLSAQNIEEQAEAYIRENLDKLGLVASDLDDWQLQNHLYSERSGLHHIYWKQTYQGTEVEAAILNINIYEHGNVLSMGSSFTANLKDVVSGNDQIGASQAVSNAAAEFQIPLGDPQLISASTATGFESLFDKAEIALEPISARQMYVNSNGSTRLVWDVQIYLKDASKWWSIKVDAETGDILASRDQVLHCSFDAHVHSNINHSLHFGAQSILQHAAPMKVDKINAPDSYRVYPLGIESPNHGGRTLEVNPADATASPFGWHDNDGVDGAEFTTTQGNNVYAQDDRDANNSGGFRPDGGASLDFDFNLDFNQDITANSPVPNESAVITNLFYWNNIIHDIFYQYGFDEASGNFQENNYGKGGAGTFDGDQVFADAQDGSGLNNANFATPTDGGSGRMQMFLWGDSDAGEVVVNSPGGIAGTYTSVPDINAPGLYNITSDVVLADDGSGNPTELCGSAVNGGDMNGKIVLIDESASCSYYTQVINAQDEGAAGVIIIKDGAGAPTTPSTGILGLFFVNIPAVMVSESDGDQMKTEIINGNTVNATMKPASDFIDGDFDSGIITHEYGHGISIRLTGGAGNSGCLQNDEQAGEGWSDWFGLVLTHLPTHTRTSPRGIGTYALEEPVTGDGIRTYPYSTDMSINPHTYGDISDPGLSVPHGVGSVFAVMLYDLYWDLIDQYGYDTDLYGGSGGNNIAIQLVIDGLKLQPCSPGFVDMRDAILAADQANYGGANEALIWQAFARRGLGFSASQGSSASRSDGTEAFDLPPGIFPVEMLSFNARSFNNDIQLNWETALEQNNQGFDIERFSEENQSFEKIAWTDGLGDTEQGHSYRFVDRDVKAGLSYTYRLKQIDFDGQFSYSDQVTAELDPYANPALVLYPNPLDQETLLIDILGVDLKSKVDISIFDKMGRRVLARSFDKDDVEGSIEIDMGELSAGLYSFKVQSAGFSKIEKLLIR
ncbi:MAG: T9SS-dependent M36 family metallopeptidase [Bacteroidota bacterium]